MWPGRWKLRSEARSSNLRLCAFALSALAESAKTIRFDLHERAISRDLATHCLIDRTAGLQHIGRTEPSGIDCTAPCSVSERIKRPQFCLDNLIDVIRARDTRFPSHHSPGGALQPKSICFTGRISGPSASLVRLFRSNQRSFPQRFMRNTPVVCHLKLTRKTR